MVEEFLLDEAVDIIDIDNRVPDVSSLWAEIDALDP